jgi:hypothetical protein
MHCNKTYSGIAPEKINNYIDSADRSGISIMSIATCEEIGNYLANYPKPSVSAPEYCRLIGERPSMPVIKNAEVMNQINEDGFVYIMFRKVPVEVVELTESTIIHGALYADGSIESSGLSVASAVSSVNGPLFGSIVAEDMIMTPIDDLDVIGNVTNQGSSLPIVDEVVYEYPTGVDEDDIVLNLFFGDNDADSDLNGAVSSPDSNLSKHDSDSASEISPESDLDTIISILYNSVDETQDKNDLKSDTSNEEVRRSARNPYSERKNAPDSDVNDLAPKPNASVRRGQASGLYPIRS